LDRIKDDKDAMVMFKEIDGNGGGIVLLDEFSEYIKKTEIEAGTEIGIALAADEAPPEGGFVDKGPPPDAEFGPTNTFLDFKGVFAPWAEQSEAGKVMRKKGFRKADPNGNGLCSLAELETFVLAELTSKFPKSQTEKDHRGDPLEKGKDLFDAFRPSYIRAFNDAKDYKADDGSTLAGTKNAKADDFVSFGEFRFFCEYLVIYGGMFDAFARIDGGGAGRDANDDRKMTPEEWLAPKSGYKSVKGYGFVCLDSIKDDDEAMAMFKAIDDNGGGIVLLVEFSEYIKKTEIAAGTAVGKLLNADELAEDAPAKKKKAEPDPLADDVPVEDRGRFLWDSYRPSYIRAFNDAKDFKKDTGKVLEGTKKSTNDDFVSFGEFRLFVVYLCVYAGMFDAFSKVDGGGAGRDAKDDRRMDLDEWLKGYVPRNNTGSRRRGTRVLLSIRTPQVYCLNGPACFFLCFPFVFVSLSLCRYKGVRDYGFVCFASLETDAEATAVFNQMDDNGGGVVLLVEFCDFIKAAEIAAGTPLGNTLDEDEGVDSGNADTFVFCCVLF
jgi:hypothetical protein